MDNDLIVCWKGSGEDEIERELKKLDRDLYLDKELAYVGGPVIYIVKHYIGSGQPPVPVLAWAEPDGTPKPLCYALIEQLKRQHGQADGAVERILAQHEKVHEERRKRAREEREESTRERMKWIKAAIDGTPIPDLRPRRFGAGRPE